MVVERRQFERSDLKYFARVYHRRLGRLIGYLVNITPSGVMVVSDKPIDPGAIVELQIELPSHDDSALQLYLDAECVWSRTDPDSDYFELGFKICDVQHDQIELIQQIIIRYGNR